REYLLRTESEFVADRVFPQENNKISDINKNLDNIIVKFIFEQINLNGYVLEKDVRLELSRILKSKGISDAKWKTIRTDLINTYDLDRIRLTKSLKETMNITNLSTTSSPFILTIKD
ncbi:hypothetical protein, partial [Sutterella wadsworthensis]|uniref:hypothetical protein n=1 Tax=Sutterella wadsworthensis TaxID=40545 RepID=UPI0032C04EF9